MSGTGLHVDGRMLRAARLAEGAPAAVAEVELAAAGDRDAFVDACIRVATLVGTPATEPVRLTWSSARLEVAEVVPSTAAALAATVRELARRGCTALVSIAAPDRTIAVGVVWDQDAADAMVDGLRAAGFADVSVEPAELSTRRLEDRPASAAVVRRGYAAAYGAALAATGMAGRIGPLRRLDLRTVVASPRAPWVLERLADPPAAPGPSPGRVVRLRAVLGRLRSTRCAS